MNKEGRAQGRDKHEKGNRNRKDRKGREGKGKGERGMIRLHLFACMQFSHVMFPVFILMCSVIQDRNNIPVLSVDPTIFPPCLSCM